ncbi:Eco57I restriction-modification methylase domain-containing protein [Halostella litorea]|uniref:Eco57I restriction-modification methylase domain-containing protein n=1 Tax=Halostella litorea TaxID=2528831 RepID=UPI001092AE2D|nr:N-6 DNA methylase [Halostella litorea]
MSDTAGFRDALHGIASRLHADMSETDVANAFLNEDFYGRLGYDGAGHDLRSEWTLPDDRRPDYVTLDANESATAVYEFKTTGRDLDPHDDQLFHYVDELKADYGVLTNGDELRLYRRDGRTHLLTVALEDATEGDAADLEAALRKPEWDVTDPDSVDEFLDRLDEVALDGQLGREHFFETFRLEENSPFADLVTAMMDLLAELRDERDAKFVTGAYDFWEASYASVPEDVPESWEPFVDGEGSLRDFMFCLESGHALLARLLLAKATDDHDFFPHSKGLRRYVDELGGFDGRIDLDAYPIAANGMIEDMRNQLVESPFEDDIFVWWTDGYGEQTASQHANHYSRFRDVAEGGSDVTRVSTATRERFSRAIAHVAFAVLKFDFSRIEGDPLGNLYQRYFDPETRKALGEFYTPQAVAEYIMDSVDYDVGVSGGRLVDPSCGSGTFLVEAVDRYLDDVRRYDDDPDWADRLTELCTHPHIVGLDVHPFAVLMAQIRFLVAVLPEYREAKRDDESFTIRRLPIFRTDTLRNERELTGVEVGDGDQTQMTLDAVTEDGRDVKIPVPLPIEVDDGEVADADREDGFLVQRVRMPRYDTVRTSAGVRNFGEYYAALQGVLDVVKFHMREGRWEYEGGLEEGIHRYTTREYDGVADFFEPYVDDVLGTVRYLRDEHGDGRLFKMFEDTVLALVVKNYMEYDYVVGNPPYVNIKGIPDARQETYERLYRSAYGRYDLYVLFLERGLGMLSADGRLGFITPNKFTRSNYGKEIRRIIAEEYSLASYVEFGDVDVFDDATNFACILTVDRDGSRTETPYAKVHRGSDGVLQDVRDRLGAAETVTEELELSTFPTDRLGADSWRFTPASVRSVAEKLDRNAATAVGDVCLGIRQGVSSGGDDAFVVDESEIAEHDLERDLLLPIVRGKHVRRWAVEWDGEYAVYPYDERGELVDLSNYPNTKAYLDSMADYLADRYCVDTGSKGIYEYDGVRPKSVYEGDFRIPTPDMSTENNFAHAEGFRCFKNTSYVATFDDDAAYSEMELLGLLNSSAAEFVVKQTSPPLRGRPFRYRYKTQYVDAIPLPEPGSGVADLAREAVEHDRLRKKVASFPGAYLDDFDGELGYVDYEWRTRRTPVDAAVEETDDGRFAVTAGRTDEITAPLLDRGDRDERRLRARYVRAAVDGRDVSEGETRTIPIPETRDDVERLLDALAADRRAVKETSVDALEAEIDRLVYDAFDLSEEDRAVVERYLDVF